MIFIRPFSPHKQPCGVSGVWMDIKKLSADFSEHTGWPPEASINLQLIICSDNEAALFLDFSHCEECEKKIREKKNLCVTVCLSKTAD